MNMWVLEQIKSVTAGGKHEAVLLWARHEKTGILGKNIMLGKKKATGKDQV